MEQRILVIGSLNMDMVVNVEQMPLRGETIMGKSLAYVPGGKGANQACAAGKLGKNVAMLGCIGDDANGSILRDSLSAAGVDVSPLVVCPGVPTGLAVITVDSTGGNSIIVIAGANGQCGPEVIRAHEQLIADHDIIVLQLEIPMEAVMEAVRLAKAHGKTVVLNPAPAPNSLPDELLRSVDYFTPNETELAKLSGMPTDTVEQAEEAAGMLIREKGVGAVLATMGSAGALLVTKEGAQLIPTKKVQAVDTTAAGDTFHGGFVTGLAEGRSLMDAIRMGNTAATISVTRKGAQTSIPTREEVDALL